MEPAGHEGTHTADSNVYPVMQADAQEDVPPAENWPSTQARHALDPVPVEYLPAAHLEHTPMPAVEYFPALQFPVTVPSDAQKDPAGQGQINELRRVLQVG